VLKPQQSRRPLLRCRRRRRIAAQGLGIVQYRILTRPEGEGMPLPCADLRDKSERRAKMPRHATRDLRCWKTNESNRGPLQPAEFSRIGPSSAPGLQRINGRESRLSLGEPNSMAIALSLVAAGYT